jgi:hypothetical protein
MDIIEQDIPARPALAGASGQEKEAGTVPSDNLVLDIGGAVGALAIYAPAGRSGHEIEISPAGYDEHRTHNVVRPRKTGPAARYAAVFPGLRAGEYTVWRDATTPAGTVTIHGGSVAEFVMPGR